MIDIEKFRRDGWVIIDHDLQDLDKLFPPILGQLLDDNAIKKIQIQYSEKIWKSDFSLQVAWGLLPIIKQLLGIDIMVQYHPYLRVARPNKPQDNIGYHKDTQYGQTPYELAVHIPFVDLDEKSALRVISGSHLMPESAFTIKETTGGVEKGSIENHIGKPYQPKRLAVPDGMETTPLCMKVGQCAIFSPAIFHGQEVNEGNVTRLSCDMRFVSSNAPFHIRRGKVHAGYVEVSKSPVNELAEKYYAINPKPTNADSMDSPSSPW